MIQAVPSFVWWLISSWLGIILLLSGLYLWQNRGDNDDG